MMTQKGRVVYDRKKNVFLPRQIARILESYSTNLTGPAFGEFILNILELTMKRKPKPREWQWGFWRFLLNSFNRGALEEIFVPKRFRKEVSYQESGLKSEVPEKTAGDPAETPTEYKRRRQLGG